MIPLVWNISFNEKSKNKIYNFPKWNTNSQGLVIAIAIDAFTYKKRIFEDV